MKQPTGRTLATLAGALLCGAVLVLLGVQIASPSTTPDPAAEHDLLLAELTELARAQVRTAAALERLERVLSDGLVTTPGDRRALGSDASAPPPSLDALVASLDALRISLESESRRTQAAIQSAPAFGGERLTDLKQRRATPDWPTLDALAQAWRADEHEANRSQHLQTARDLVEAYGQPSTIYRPKGGLQFVYRRHPEGGTGPALYFRLQDGFVIEFWVEDEHATEDG